MLQLLSTPSKYDVLKGPQQVLTTFYTRLSLFQASNERLVWLLHVTYCVMVCIGTDR